jgi:hypothetical protein
MLLLDDVIFIWLIGFYRAAVLATKRTTDYETMVKLLAGNYSF